MTFLAVFLVESIAKFRVSNRLYLVGIDAYLLD